jgi:hypothetical protein
MDIEVQNQKMKCCDKYYIFMIIFIGKLMYLSFI